MTKVKICGLNTPESMTAAIEAGADFVGLVFYPTSPRYIDMEVATYLAHYVPEHVKICGLFVNEKDEKLAEILSNVRIDMMQFHGDETPKRLADIKSSFKKPIIKAISINDTADLEQIDAFKTVSDWYLLDAPGGGTGQSFDWSLLDGFQFPKPWMLAGGLTPENVGMAIKNVKPDAVDVSSGVESARGVKDTDKIHSFIQAVHAA